MDPAKPSPAFAPALFYKDPKAALAFLEAAFGFETTMLLTDQDGNLVHSQMEMHGSEGRIMVGTEWKDNLRSPASLDGRNTQTVHVQVKDADAHCGRARAAGAVILMEPEDQFYGDRTYRAADLEGHEWSFAQPVRAVPRAEAAEKSGLTIDAKDWS